MLLVDGEKTTIPLRQYGWKNLYVTTPLSFVGESTFNTERAARDYADSFFAEWQEYVDDGRDEPVDLPDGSTIPFSDFKFAIQLPVID